MAGDTPLLLTENNLQALINKIRSDYTDPLSYVKECIYSGTSIVPVTIQNHQVSDYEFLILKVGAGTERRFFTLPVNTDTTTIEIIGRNTSSSGLITLSDGVVNISHANVTINKLDNSVAVVPTTWTSADFKCTLLEVYGMRAVREASSPYFFPTMADIMLAAHPVNSLYISKDPTDPGTLFGGTWTRIKDCMLWAAGDSDTVATNVFTSESGNKSVTLSCNNLPDHHHAFSGSSATTASQSTSTSGSSYVPHKHQLNSGNTSSAGTTTTAGIRKADSSTGSTSVQHTHTLNSHTHSLNSHKHPLTYGTNDSTAWTGGTYITDGTALKTLSGSLYVRDMEDTGSCIAVKTAGGLFAYTRTNSSGYNGADVQTGVGYGYLDVDATHSHKIGGLTGYSDTTNTGAPSSNSTSTATASSGASISHTHTLPSFYIYGNTDKVDSSSTGDYSTSHTHSYSHTHTLTAKGKATGVKTTGDADFTQSALNIMNPHNKVYVWQRTA